MNTLLNNAQIQSILPHRHPMQLVDQVVAFDKGKSITALRAIGTGEPALTGHFPGFPIMPGVLIIEALGQACALLLELTERNWSPGEAILDIPEKGMLGVLCDVKVRLLKPVFPGTLVQLEAEVDWNSGPASSLKVKAHDGTTTFAKGSIKVAMAPKASLLGQAVQSTKEPILN